MKKTLALILALLMIISVFPLFTFANNEDIETEMEKVRGWMESDTSLSLFTADDLKLLSMTSTEKELYNVEYNSDGYLDIEIVGNENNAESWKKEYLSGENNSEIFFHIRNNFDHLFSENTLYVNQYNGNGENFFEDMKNSANTATLARHEGFQEKERCNDSIGMITAQVITDSYGNKVVVPRSKYVEMTLFALMDTSGTITYKLLVTYVHSGESANRTYIDDNYLSGTDRILTITDIDGKDDAFFLNYQDSVYILNINEEKYTYTDIINGENNKSVRIKISAPGGFEGEKEVRFTYQKEGTPSHGIVTESVCWENEQGEKYYEKIRIKTGFGVIPGTTWMDKIASPTNAVQYVIQKRHDDPRDIVSPEIIHSMTNMEIADEGSGLLHLKYENDEVTVWDYQDIRAELIAPDNAVFYTENECGGDAWADPNNNIANEQMNIVDRKGKHTVADGLPGIGLAQFSSFEVDGVTTYYAEHLDGNQVLLVSWFDKDENLIKREYLYTYSDDYIWSRQTQTYQSISDITNPVDDPVIIGDNLGDNSETTKIVYFPQSSEEGSYYFQIEEDGWSADSGDGISYSVVLPYSFLGYEDQQDAMNHEDGAVIDHLNDQNKVQENNIECSFEEYGVVFEVSSFSPFVIKHKGGQKRIKVFYDGGKGLKATYETLYEAIYDVEDVDNEIIMIDGEESVLLDKEKDFHLSSESSGKVIINVEDGLSIELDGKNVGNRLEYFIEGQKPPILIRIIKDKEGPDPIIPERKSRDTVVITIGKATEEVPSDEANPNTGAVNFIGVFESLAVLAFAGAFFRKKR